MLSGPPKDNNVLSLFRLTGKVAVVTGGTRGIGWEASQAMAEAGAQVAIIYTAYPNPEDRIAELEALGVKCRAYKSSTNDAQAIDATLQQIVKDFGKIDIVIASTSMSTDRFSLPRPLERSSKLRGMGIYCSRPRYLGQLSTCRNARRRTMRPRRQSYKCLRVSRSSGSISRGLIR